MLVYAGIDEAGYGPLLGPLCVGLTVFTIQTGPDGATHEATDEAPPPSAGPPDLWTVLRHAVCHSRRDRQRRIAVDDSKALKSNRATTIASGHAEPHLEHLERGVLTFLAATSTDDTTDDIAYDAATIASSDLELFSTLGVALPSGSTCPWYDASESTSTDATPRATALPRHFTLDELAIQVARLRRALRSAGVTCTMMRCAALDPAEFNQRIRQTDSKAAVNLALVLRHAYGVWQQFPRAHPRIVIDRQGGRSQYVRDLQLAWPDANIRIVAEESTFSRYHLRDGDREMTVSFVTEAEKRHLPVALASMVAKYVRELCMMRLNRYFCAHLPELKPTAGYVQDGRRYLAEIEPVIKRMRLSRDALVRNR